ncbi:MAG: radical SAM protein [Deltaproteobacteria bacterium]|nr:radical SAM protein [Deltaproteobacteria bacterium]
MELLDRTESICPVCLKALPAEIWDREGDIRLERTCPEHGSFETVIWRGKPDFRTWKRSKAPLKVAAQTEKDRGCPFDCGLCPDHVQNPCTVLMEITSACNLRCPVCFADSGVREDFVPIDELVEHLKWIRRQQGQIVFQISGGEPTLHPDLPRLIAEAVRLFPAVQLNTNGLLLASREGLARELAASGLSWVFLQFDGLTDSVYRVLRGRDLLSQKLAAIEACSQAGLSVVLVPTLVRGLNDRQLGDLVELARSRPNVRGVHIQPLAQAGRSSLSGDGCRLTIPEILELLSSQTQGLIQPEQAFPPGCEHERCSFHLRFRRLADGRLRPQVPRSEDCGCGPLGCPPKSTLEPGTPAETDGSRRRAVDIIIQSWGAAGPAEPGSPDSGGGRPSPLPDPSSPAEPGSPAPGKGNGRGILLPMARKKPLTLDDFLAQAKRETFSVTGMAFQDAGNMDLARLKGCCVHIFRPPDRLIPFCAMNLTSAQGRSLYR